MLYHYLFFLNLYTLGFQLIFVRMHVRYIVSTMLHYQQDNKLWIYCPILVDPTAFAVCNDIS